MAGILLLLLPDNRARAQHFHLMQQAGTDSVRNSAQHHILPLQPMPLDTQLFSKPFRDVEMTVSFKPKRSTEHFYNPRNVMPVNPLLLDYRGSSYYTPKIVQDRLTFFMNRPRADSFVPVPVVAMLAANIALKYVDIEMNLRLTAKDYLLEKPFFELLKALWLKSPRTVSELYRLKGQRNGYTYHILQSEMETLVDKRLVKRREMEAGETRYFPAQSSEEVIQLLNDALMDGSLHSTERTAYAHLLSELKQL